MYWYYVICCTNKLILISVRIYYNVYLNYFAYTYQTTRCIYIFAICICMELCVYDYRLCVYDYRLCVCIGIM